MVIAGGLVAVAGAYSYLRSKRELETGTFRPAVGLHLAIVAVVVMGAIAVAVFLVTTPGP